jgi:hypothetical protein
MMAATPDSVIGPLSGIPWRQPAGRDAGTCFHQTRANHSLKTCSASGPGRCCGCTNQ